MPCAFPGNSAAQFLGKSGAGQACGLTAPAEVRGASKSGAYFCGVFEFAEAGLGVLPWAPWSVCIVLPTEPDWFEEPMSDEEPMLDEEFRFEEPVLDELFMPELPVAEVEPEFSACLDWSSIRPVACMPWLRWNCAIA
jgi:hypothetical protein